MLKQDRERLESAQQAVDLAQESVKNLYSAEDLVLAEHAYDMMEQHGRMNQKLRRLLDIN